MITRIYAHSAAERRHGSPNQAIDCNRTLAVQQYLFLRKIHGLSAENARDRLHQIMFIGVTGGGMKPAQLPAAREVVMRRTDDVQVVIEPRAIGLEVAAQV